MLEFKNISLKLGDSQVLQDISFSVMPSEMVAILGVSGAGKSSLFQLLIGAQRPTNGEVCLDQIVLSELSANSLQKYRKQIGVVFQDFRLLPKKNAYDNIAFALEVCGDEEHISVRVPKLLSLVGLSGKGELFPHQLSGGEKQRVAVARALVHNPKILIADEATGNLDPGNTREIGRLFKKLNQETGITILFSTHDDVLIEEINPRVIRLEAGRMVL
jgi:cell division transport system ATP-binding protein